jgi:uncharacterized lipoprotein YajG
MRSVLSALVAVMLVLGSVGCSHSPEVQVTAPKYVLAAPPASGPAVLVRVADAREFQIVPHHTQQPSMGDAGDAKQPAIRARALARMKDGHPFMLPQGQTVAGLVREVIEGRLRASGYSIANEKTAAGALPVDVEVTYFWCSTRRAFTANSLRQRIEITMKGQPVANGSAKITANGSTLPLRASGGNIGRTVELSLADLSNQVAAAIKPAD